MLAAIKVVIDDTLSTYYHEDSSSFFFDNGEIWTTDYEAPRLKTIISYVQESKDLLEGQFFGKTPYVIKVLPDVLDAYRADLVSYDASRIDSLESYEGQETSEVKERLWLILQQAIDRGSSDVHIEVHKGHTSLYSRVDGSRVPIGNDIPDPSYGMGLFSVLFLDVATDKLADFAANTANAGRVEHPLRVSGELRNTIWRASYMPAKDNGGKVSLRWLNKTETIPPMAVLGYTRSHLEQFENFIRRSKGILLVSGVTNSGKSTLIASLIQRSKELYPGRSHHTLEDPPEFDLGVIQTHVQCNQKVSEDGDEYKDYSYYIKVLLRQDPDFISVGEIRDHEVAMGTCRMGDAGQLVVATLHTSSAVGIGETLISQYKVDPAVLATPDLMCIWATQTLVRTLCKECKVPHHEAEKVYREEDFYGEYERGMKVINAMPGDDSNIFWRHPNGCNKCNDGEKGLTSCLEMIVFDDEDRTYLSNADYLGWHHSLHKKGFKELKDHAMLKVRQGLLDINTAYDRVPTMYKQAAEDVYNEMFDD